MPASYKSIADDFDFLLKVVMIGDSGVGKSSILHRYSNDDFKDNYISTIGVDFEIKTFDLDGKGVKMQIWDTAGQERFHNITTSYYRNSHCIMMVYDVTDPQSFRNMPKWLAEIRRYGGHDTKVLMVGNKSDLAHRRIVSLDEAQEMSRQLGLAGHVVETSAKDNTNVEKAFDKIARDALAAKLYRTKAEHKNVIRPTGDDISSTTTTCPACIIQ